MPTFVSTIVDELASTSVAFVTTVVQDYWEIFLGIALVIGLAGAFWKFAKLGR